MPRPLDNSYESSSDDDGALRVDAAFAKAYSAREQKRLDARRAAGGDGVLDAGGASSSDSESSDDDGAAALTPRVEADVLKTMAAIRRRDAAVYDGTTAFFADAPRARARAGAAEGAATTFKDLARARLAAGDAGADAGAAPSHPHAYDAEQRALRQAMVEAGAGDADECALFHPKRAGGGGADDRAPVRAALDELRAGEEPAVEFVEGDLFGAAAVARWRGAAVVLANVLLFGAADKARLAALLGEALRPGAWVLSTAPLADARLARRQEGVHVKTSWTGGAKVDVYQVVGAP